MLGSGDQELGRETRLCFSTYCLLYKSVRGDAGTHTCAGVNANTRSHISAHKHLLVYTGGRYLTQLCQQPPYRRYHEVASEISRRKCDPGQ